MGSTGTACLRAHKGEAKSGATSAQDPGDLKSDDFSAFFLNGDVVEGVLTVNRAFEMGIGKRLVERRISVNPAALADPMTDLRGFLKIKSAAA